MPLHPEIIRKHKICKIPHVRLVIVWRLCFRGIVWLLPHLCLVFASGLIIQNISQLPHWLSCCCPVQNLIGWSLEWCRRALFSKRHCRIVLLFDFCHDATLAIFLVKVEIFDKLRLLGFGCQQVFEISCEEIVWRFCKTFKKSTTCYKRRKTLLRVRSSHVKREG